MSVSVEAAAGFAFSFPLLVLTTYVPGYFFSYIQLYPTVRGIGFLSVLLGLGENRGWESGFFLAAADGCACVSARRFW
ncbi:hypothetical protein QBC39DRAFT_31654 [Podospora conica]|nr:hypothetical protein QBC39DRAFT_31654 [Schizothecium conicum]